jgi:lipid-binding SYLF domain-containing protein
MQQSHFMSRVIYRSGLVLTALALAGGPLTACTTTPPSAVSEKSTTDKGSTINAQVDSTLSRLYRTVPGSQEIVTHSKGVLVFPSVLAAGLVVGAEYGEGALRSGSRTLGYYRLVSGSIGYQAGAQSKAVILVFQTEDALNKFVNSKGWTVGADATVAVAKIGANGTVDTATFQKPVVSFTLTNAGLMAGVSLEGTKISRLNT